MKKIVYIILFSTLLSCNSNGISDSLIENNDKEIYSFAAFMQIRYDLDPYKVLSSYTKSENLISSYNLLLKNIEIGDADNIAVQNYLSELVSLGIIQQNFYSENDFNYSIPGTLKYQIQNVTLHAIRNLKCEFYEDYYGSLQTYFLTKKKDNIIELIPFVQDTLADFKILLGKLKPNTNEFSKSFIVPDSLNRITTDQLKKIGLEENIEGVVIFRKFDGWLDTLRFKEIIK